MEWLDCCQMPGPLHADDCANRVSARTIDGVLIRKGLRVIDYNLDLGVVDSIHHVESHPHDRVQDVVWYNIRLDNGGRSSMDGGRLWTRLQTNSGWLIA
jgi:hypothetical protein